MNAATAKIEVIPPASTNIAEYSATEAALAELESQLKGVEFEVATTSGMKLAKESRFALVKMRTTIEAYRKELKEPLLKQGKLIDSEAKRITDRIAALEAPIDEQIKAEERRKEAERQAKERAIAERIAGMVRRIEDVRRMPLSVVNSSAADVSTMRESLGFHTDDELTFGMDDHHAAEMLAARTDTLAKLDDMIAAKLRAEAEQAAIAEERARLEAERKALEEQRKVEAEAARLQAEARDRELAELRAAEEARLAAERAEIEAAEAEAERIAKEQREAEERSAQQARLRMAALQAAGPELADALKKLLASYLAVVKAANLSYVAADEQVVADARAALSKAGVVMA